MHTVPGESEEAVRVAIAEAVSALVAHPHGAGGRDDASGQEEGLEEAELPLRCPAVGTLLGLLHPPGWSTNRKL